jgi:hypothetical protein
LVDKFGVSNILGVQTENVTSFMMRQVHNHLGSELMFTQFETWYGRGSRNRRNVLVCGLEGGDNVSRQIIRRFRCQGALILSDRPDNSAPVRDERELLDAYGCHHDNRF